MPDRTPDEINRLLAEKVMGWHREGDYWWDATKGFRFSVARWEPFDSPDQCIADIVPAMEKRGYHWVARGSDNDGMKSFTFIRDFRDSRAYHVTFSGAICLAALAAGEGEELE